MSDNHGFNLADMATPTPPARPLWSRVQPGQFAPALGLAGLALLLQRMQGGASWLDLMVAGLALGVWLIVALCLTGKYLHYRPFLVLDLTDPLRTPFAATSGFALFMIAGALSPWSLLLGRALWILGLALILIVTVHVLRQWITKSIQPAHVTPAWFLPIVGPGVASAVGPDLGFPELSMLFYLGGGVGWLMLLPMVMYRLSLHDLPPAPMLPTVAILIAPPCIGAVAWAEMTGDVTSPVVIGFFGAALLMVLITLSVLPEMLRSRFNPSHWSLSFPLAALGSAALIVAQGHAGAGWQMLAGALSGLAVMVISWLSVRSLWALAHGRYLPA